MSQTEDYYNLRVNKDENILTSHLDIAVYVNTSCDTGNRKKCLIGTEFTLKVVLGKFLWPKYKIIHKKNKKGKIVLKEKHSSVEKSGGLRLKS